LTRPAFSQELTYPVNSREIRFKELVIGINRVAADRINFTVISDGSKAAAPTAPPPPPNI
jgi:hypothetical protein